MKVITMYLPQFHRVKENDEWWGDGFTEWTAVKRAEKIYEEHYQPHVPLKHNYYDLLNRETMKWQADLMKKYGVDGQCFYHYWFKDGRQILEKPAENLLQWKDIDMPYCFCWANETWARTWSKISSKNVWASTFEEKEEINSSGILLEQKYGDEEQWKEHFKYLLSFFCDSRYIKVENKPIFIIYKSALISCLDEMMNKWNEWAIQEGFDGIYVIGGNSNSNIEKSLDAILYHEPQYTVGKNGNKDSGRKTLLRLKYDEVWQELLNYESTKKNVIYEGFVGYDDTPRRGRSGSVIDDATPEKFKGYLSELIAKNIASGNDLVFINAWNEWGEGMHLEPDEKYGYGFLEAIPYAKEHYKEYLEKYEIVQKKNSFAEEIENLLVKNARYESYWRVLDAWMNLKEEGVFLQDYFINRHIHSIAIYGIGMLGKHLLKELENGSIQIAYAIDRRTDIHLTIPVYNPDDKLPPVDAIIITATYAFSEICSQLKEKGYERIVSLEEIIMEMM